MQACLAAFSRFAGISLLLLTLVQCCTVYEFNGSGFAANAFALVHMVPVFHNTNGTFFLDNTWNHYKCSEEGGWHDFFSWEDQVSAIAGGKAEAMQLVPRTPFRTSHMCMPISAILLSPDCPLLCCCYCFIQPDLPCHQRILKVRTRCSWCQSRPPQEGIHEMPYKQE